MKRIIKKLQSKIQDFLISCFEKSCDSKFSRLEEQLQVGLSEIRVSIERQDKETQNAVLQSSKRQKDMEGTIKTLVSAIEKEMGELCAGLEHLRKEMTQLYKDKTQMDAQNKHALCNCMETGLSKIHLEAGRLTQKANSFLEYYYARERDLQNCIDYLQEKVEYTIRRQYELETLTLTVMSCVQNEVVTVDSVRGTKRYQYFSHLHQLTQVRDVDAQTELIRVGKSFDGGYIMASPLSSEKIAYSIGICDDVSWDLDMARMGYQVYQYDHTIQSLPEEHSNFHWKKLGLGGENRGELRTLGSILSENGHAMALGMVLKIDIEGGEWEVLNSCSEELLSRFDQIVLELHNLVKSQDQEAILRALELLNKTHFVAHVHGNNYGCVEYCGDLMTPNLLEVTYLSREKYRFTNRKSNACIDFGLDRPNRSDIPDINLSSW